MKGMWTAVGLGALVAIVGYFVMTAGRNYNLGVLLVLGGLVVAVMALIIRFVMIYVGPKVKE